jgi:hypothetical protein
MVNEILPAGFEAEIFAGWTDRNRPFLPSIGHALHAQLIDPIK